VGLLLVDVLILGAAARRAVSVRRNRAARRQCVHAGCAKRFVAALGGTLKLIADLGDEQPKIA